MVRRKSGNVGGAPIFQCQKPVPVFVREKSEKVPGTGNSLEILMRFKEAEEVFAIGVA